MGMLGDILIEQEESVIITRNSQNNRISGLLYHYPPEMPDSIPMSIGSREVAEKTLSLGTPLEIVVEIENLSKDSTFVLETLDQNHGCALKAWAEIGYPEPPSREQTELLKKTAMGTKKEIVETDSRGKLVINKTLMPWSVISIKQV